MRPIALLCLTLSLASPLLARQPVLPEADRVRLAEAFRLAEAVGDTVWAEWSSVPFTVLFLTPEYEFLLRHPDPPDDFASLGYDELLGTEVYARPNTDQYDLGFLATFPAVGGVNTVVIGSPEHSGKSSTLWVLVALHEHFHQLQYAGPSYWEAVAALDLAGDDASGMWMLNYPFPYDDPDVGARFGAYRDALVQALTGAKAVPVEAGYRTARERLRSALDAPAYRYLSFQLWQEGVARYTEIAAARAAVAAGYEPLPAFRSLPDALSYAEAADTLRSALARELEELDLTGWKRVVFYPTGAAEALLLDASSPGWRRHYFDEPFYLERYSQAE